MFTFLPALADLPPFSLVLRPWELRTLGGRSRESARRLPGVGCKGSQACRSKGIHLISKVRGQGANPRALGQTGKYGGQSQTGQRANLTGHRAKVNSHGSWVNGKFQGHWRSYHG